MYCQQGLYDKAAGNPILMIGDLKAGFTKYRVGTQLIVYIIFENI